VSSYRQFWFFATQEDPVNADVLTTRVADGIAVITLGSARRIYFDEEMGDALTEALDRFAGDANVRVVVVTGGAPGYFIRHFTVAALIRLAESLRASGREWPENATYNGGFFDKAMALVREHAKAGHRRHFRHSARGWIRVCALLRPSYR
jgi:enoyl-CoA hydratase/carnithine racemase